MRLEERQQRLILQELEQQVRGQPTEVRRRAQGPQQGPQKAEHHQTEAQPVDQQLERPVGLPEGLVEGQQGQRLGGSDICQARHHGL